MSVNPGLVSETSGFGKTISRVEVSSCASRPIEAAVRINEIETAKSIADLETSYSITGAKLQTHFEVLDSKKRVVSRRSSTETSKEESSCKKKLHKKKHAFSREGKSHG